MIEVMTIIKASMAAAICIRLFCYGWPQGARYRVGVTTAAYFLMLCSGGVSILLLLGNQAAAQIFDAGIYTVILLLMLAARGNLAKILEIRHG